MTNYKNTASQIWMSSYVPEATSSDVYYHPTGLIAGNATEINTQSPLIEAKAFTLLSINVTANANATNCHLFLRDDGSSGSLDVTITGSTTGVFQDVTNSQAVVVDSLINYFFDYTGSGNVTIQSITVKSS